jgi:hypothetical protein
MAEMTIKRFNILSVAKLQGLLTFVIGLIIGVIYGLIVMLFGAAMAAMVPKDEGQMLGGIGSVVVGLIIMVVFPIMYGLMGFIGGAIGALIYNLAARFVGGVKFEFEGVMPGYSPPAQHYPSS